MTSAEIREAFLRFFETKAHTRVKSSSLVPVDDPTLFFTNAGMVQFKDVFTGREQRPYTRACSSQKCMRVSGKHNDLENVGHTPRHHTFFEMLGNFSFGDYFKEGAIDFAWEFLTKTMGLSPDCLCATVFREDDEAERLWKKVLPAGRIYRLDEKDNFWAMGETGPCGPCSEILWDFGKGPATREELDSDRFMEIWNLVFMQFDRGEGGQMAPLAAPSIDTGMGLERLSCVLQGVRSNWETDLFTPIIRKVAEVTGCAPGASPDVDIALRVIADHIRGSVFLIGDGVLPSNEGRGYVLRRILRRAIRYGKRLGCDGPFLKGIAHVVVDEMGAVYPELATHQPFIEKVIGAEDERFFETLDRGLELLQGEMKRAAGRIIPGDVAFQLYDTFGFPLDVTQQIAEENGFSVDAEGFAARMEEQRERARASWKGSGEDGVAGVFREIAASGVRSVFVGYSEESAEATIVAIVVDGKRVPEAQAPSAVQFITDVTPFYGESGGQAGDAGMAIGFGIEVGITDAKKPVPDLVVHAGEIRRGTLAVGTKLSLAIDDERRQQTRCNHTATHLLHHALREVLGEHVKQAGSSVTPQRLRFDFSHFQAMSPEEVRDVERRVNEAVRKNARVSISELTYDEAVAGGALAFFGEKYGDRVRMVDVAGISRELCGGTHVAATGEIGICKITAESSVAAGVRRIEAVTGAGAEAYVAQLERERAEVAQALRAQPGELAVRAKKLAEEVARLERELRAAKHQTGAAANRDLMSEVREVGGIRVLAARVDAPDRQALAEWAERYRDKLGKGVVALVGVFDDKASIVVAVSKELCPKVHAGKIVQALAEAVGGKGGGRPDFAQGGGTDLAKLDEALKKVEELVR